MDLSRKDTEAMLSPGEYLFMAGADGQIIVVVGPIKKSIDSTNELLVFDDKSKSYKRVPSVDLAKKLQPIIDENSYAVLHNPAQKDNNHHPDVGSSQVTPLIPGKKVNLKGPATFALWPGQIVEVIPGHVLRTNQYLVIRVYNQEEAAKNWDVKIIPPSDPNSEALATDIVANTIAVKNSLVNGQLFIIRGTEVSFYIPPTGIEVLRDSATNTFVRDAVTLENLEYCILKNEGGVKRYIEGPAVVFPEPDETFDSKNGTRVFRGIELNENMGIHVKVISEYDNFEVGEELFITGEDNKIYMPRPEHAIIKYGDKDFVHYAIAVPEGDGRYVLDKNKGKILTITGPTMLLPDPRKEVIVRRILNESQCDLLYPGNEEVMQYNMNAMREENLKNNNEAGPSGAVYMAGMSQQDDLDRYSNVRNTLKKETRGYFSSHDLVSESMTRKQGFTKPRSITMTDSKFEGAVKIGVWPGYAVQIIKVMGSREVVIGPKTVLLDYNETLEMLALSTGTPKQNNTLLKTSYLQIYNNKITDIITAVTSDMVKVDIKVGFRVNFVEEHKDKWFNVSDYIKLLTDHCRSLIANVVKRNTIAELNSNYIDLVRDTILGKNESGQRTGRTFDNGMCITEVDIKSFTIMDNEISNLLKQTQQDSVRNSLEIIKANSAAEAVKQIQSAKRSVITQEHETLLLGIDHEHAAELLRLKNDLNETVNELEVAKKQQEISVIDNEVETAAHSVEVEFEKDKVEIITRSYVDKLKAIQPELVQALITSGQMQLANTLAEHIPGSRTTLHDIFDLSSMDLLRRSVAGTPLEEGLNGLYTKKNGKVASNVEEN